MRTPILPLFLLATQLATTAHAAALSAAQAAILQRPVVLELFTSQSCSSCPPADRYLAELATNPAVLALDFHVDYWNHLGWHDPFSSAASTARQTAYARALASDVYTPQLVIDGAASVVGSDRAAVSAAITAATARQTAVPLTLTRTKSGLTATLGAALNHGPHQAHLLLVGYDTRHVTHIGGGENGGETLTEINVVRGFTDIGTWHGTPITLSALAPLGEHLAALLQADDATILGAAVAPNS